MHFGPAGTSLVYKAAHEESDENRQTNLRLARLRDDGSVSTSDDNVHSGGTTIKARRETAVPVVDAWGTPLGGSAPQPLVSNNLPHPGPHQQLVYAPHPTATGSASPEAFAIIYNGTEGGNSTTEKPHRVPLAQIYSAHGVGPVEALVHACIEFLDQGERHASLGSCPAIVLHAAMKARKEALFEEIIQSPAGLFKGGFHSFLLSFPQKFVLFRYGAAEVERLGNTAHENEIRVTRLRGTDPNPTRALYNVFLADVAFADAMVLLEGRVLSMVQEWCMREPQGVPQRDICAYCLEHPEFKLFISSATSLRKFLSKNNSIFEVRQHVVTLRGRFGSGAPTPL